jgi:hypothetical protein
MLNPDLLIPGPDTDQDPAIQVNPDPFPNPNYRVLMTKKWRKIYSWNLINIFFWSKIEIYLSQGRHKDLQAIGAAFSPQKRTSSASKDEFFTLFYIFRGHFFPLLDPEPDPDF